MVLPTLVVAGMIAWQSRHEAEDLVHNIAVCLWIIANIVWMTGEFFYEDMTREMAKMFFFAGMLLLVLFYVQRVLKSRSV